MSSLSAYIAAAVISVTAAVTFAASVTAISGLTGTVVLLWASVAMLTATLAASVYRAARAWRRGYWLGFYHGRSQRILSRRMEMVRAR
ncbi:hypothetical protein ACFMQL_20240 [Nonomuraea fastidiosa]|uniref:hypothetical protein n=1 Tax=Nonomuraea fastidiosa TaxID=46173 RepID=UPI003671FE10